MKMNDSWPVPETSTRSIDVKKKLSEVHAVVHAYDNFPVALINPSLQAGPWIAGGAALSWYQNKPVGSGDIDVFCNNHKQFNDLYDMFTSKDLNCTVVFRSENAITFNLTLSTNQTTTRDDFDFYKKVVMTRETVVTKEWRVQLIKRYFDNVDALLNDFDITVCQVATNGEDFYLKDKVAKDINNKVLSIRKVHKTTIKRLIKYWSYGFEPTNETMDMIINNAGDYNWEFTDADDYENAF